MSDDAENAATSAEKAYAAAAQGVAAKSAQDAPAPPTKAKAIEVAASGPEPAAKPVTAPKAPPMATEAKPKPVAAKAAAKRKTPAPKPKTTALAKPKTFPKPKVLVKAAKIKAAKPKIEKPAPLKTGAVKSKSPPHPKPIMQIKEAQMAKTPEFTKSVSDAMSEIQTRAKEAYEKSTEMAGEASEFTKGNVEAIVESGKILTSGMQDMGKTCIDEAKSAFETLTTDMKEIASIKSPTELFQLQSKLMRRNFDSLIAFGSKSSEAMVKLANESMSPISSRMSIAADKVSKVAA